jgi:hypothetical protein
MSPKSDKLSNKLFVDLMNRSGKRQRALFINVRGIIHGSKDIPNLNLIEVFIHQSPFAKIFLTTKNQAPITWLFTLYNIEFNQSMVALIRRTPEEEASSF